MSLVRYFARRELGFTKSRRPDRDVAGSFVETKATIPTENQPCELSGKTRSTFLVAFSFDGQYVASAQGDHTVRVTCLDTGRQRAVLRGHPRTPWCIAFHPSKPDLIGSGCLGGEVRVWDLRGRYEVWKNATGTVINSLSFHPHDKVLVIATLNQLLFWNWEKAEPFVSVETKHEFERVRWVKFDPLGQFLYTGVTTNRPQRVEEDLEEPSRLVDMAGGYVRSSLRHHYRSVTDRTQRRYPVTIPLESTEDAERARTTLQSVLAARDYAARETERLRGQGHPVGGQGHSSAFVVPGPEPLEPEPGGDGLLQTVQLPSIVTSALSPYEREIRRYEQSSDSLLNREVTGLALTGGRQHQPSFLRSSDADHDYSSLLQPSDVTARHGDVAYPGGDVTSRPGDVTYSGGEVPDDAALLVQPVRMSLEPLLERISREAEHMTSSQGHVTAGQGHTESDQGAATRVVSTGRAVTRLDLRAGGDVTSASAGGGQTSPSLSRREIETWDVAPGAQPGAAHAQPAAPPVVELRNVISRIPVLRIPREHGRAYPRDLAYPREHSVSLPREHSVSLPREHSVSLPREHSVSLPRDHHSVPLTIHREHTLGSMPREHSVSLGIIEDTPAAMESPLEEQSADRPPPAYRRQGSLLLRRARGSLVRVPPPTRPPRPRMTLPPPLHGLTDPDLIIDPDDVWTPEPSAFSAHVPLSDSTDTLGDHGNRPTVLRNPYREPSPADREDTLLAHHVPAAQQMTSSPAPRAPRPLSRRRLTTEPPLPAPHHCRDCPLCAGRRASAWYEAAARDDVTRDVTSPREEDTTQESVFSALHDVIRAEGDDVSSQLGHLRRVTSSAQQEQQRLRRMFRDRQRARLRMTVTSETPASAADQSAADALRAIHVEAPSELAQEQQRPSIEERFRSFQAEMTGYRARRLRERTYQRAVHRRVLHPHYSRSVYDYVPDILPQNINRTLAAAFLSHQEPGVAANVDDPHRIQRWDFTQCAMPDLTQVDRNVVVSHVKLLNDASLEMSADGRCLATFTQSARGFPEELVLGVYSLQAGSVGDCLFTKNFGPNAITVSLSPLSNFVLVGLASKRQAMVNPNCRMIVGQVYRLSKRGAGEDSMESVCDIMHPPDSELRSRLNFSVNTTRWLPGLGAGLLYTSNKGDMHFCRPGEDADRRRREDDRDRAGRPAGHVPRGSAQPSTQSAATQTSASQVRRSTSTQTDGHST